jgi:hypothetical protein
VSAVTCSGMRIELGVGLAFMIGCGAIAIAVFGALVASPGGFIPGMRISLMIAAAIVAAMALTSLRIRAHTAR